MYRVSQKEVLLFELIFWEKNFLFLYKTNFLLKEESLTLNNGVSFIWAIRWKDIGK